MNKYWDSGADMRFITVPLPEHGLNAVTGWAPAVAWTSAVLALPQVRSSISGPPPLCPQASQELERIGRGYQ